MVQEPREFPETHWSQLLELKNPSHPRHAEHLDDLVHHYWKPAYLYLRAIRAMSAEDAEDLTQQFFAMLLARHVFDKLSPDRGSFRGFLKTALKYFLIDQDRTALAHAPRDGARFFPFEEAEAAWKDARTGTPVSTPDEAFDREWARGVLFDAVAHLKKELAAEGKDVYFALFSEFWSERGTPDGASNASYGSLARKHSVTESDVGNYLRVVRQRLQVIVQEIVTAYLGPGENVEDEIKFILSR
jgi:RNA polymerase sigma-70 factor (ECF subfamily)